MMGVSGMDFGHVNRRKWVRCYGKGCTRNRAERNRERWGFVVLCLIGAVLGFASARAIGCEPQGLGLFAGVGVHAKGLSAPDYTTPNPIGLIELRYTAGRFEAALSHRSSLQGFPAVFDSPEEYGYGVNMLEGRVRLW